ncbi:MAG: aspartate carbamoyltransferase regulatory subunit [Candidatus Norongarragalinales archaeon]
MSEDNEFLKARKIERGIVIDHIPAGRSFLVLRILGIDESFPGSITLLTNVPSTKFGLKDLIKIEGKEIGKSELEKLAILSPYISVNIVRDYKAVEKFRVSLPEVITDVAKCPNASCESNKTVQFKFIVEEREPVKLRCAYCNQVFKEKQLLG